MTRYLKGYYTTQEVAEILGKHHRTVSYHIRKLNKTGKFGTKPGRDWVITEKELEILKNRRTRDDT